jgi:ribosomal protein S25
MEKTTVQLTRPTLERLKRFKRHERESYEEVVNKLMDDAEEETLSAEDIEDLQEALEEVKQGKTVSAETLAKKYGIKLA